MTATLAMIQPRTLLHTSAVIHLTIDNGFFASRTACGLFVDKRTTKDRHWVSCRTCLRV